MLVLDELDGPDGTQSSSSGSPARGKKTKWWLGFLGPKKSMGRWKIHAAHSADRKHKILYVLSSSQALWDHLGTNLVEVLVD